MIDGGDAAPRPDCGDRKTVVVVGNGMVGHRFCEKLVEFDSGRAARVVVFGEEPRAAYDRVGLTSFFAHRDPEKLALARREWYAEHGLELHVGDRAAAIDRERKVVRSEKGLAVGYDCVVLATGSLPFVPPIPGVRRRGVFVYRTIDDLERILDYARSARRCAVLGGGLLGLEAARAACELGLETHVVEVSERLMPRQIDEAGSRVLVRRIEAMGVRVHLGKSSKEIHGADAVEALEFADGESLAVDMVVVSAGIRPRDDLARACGLNVAERGGVIVDDRLRSSDENVLAVGECASHRGRVYGLVGPGYEMAEVAAANLAGGRRAFQGADLSTKLKLMGCDVASFGDYEAQSYRAVPLVFEDPLAGVYKKLLFTKDGGGLVGGILVGDASNYGLLAATARSGAPLPCKPHELLLGAAKGSAAPGGVDALPDEAQICSCNNVCAGRIRRAVVEESLATVEAVKQSTRAGSGCGGCAPLVADLLAGELKKAGKVVVPRLCEHFDFSRTELFALIKVKRLKTFDEVLAACGRGRGCEICKPAVASILAGLWNEHVLEREHQTIQDTNDRFLANLQRGGTYSVVPRVPGGEITPDKLIALGSVAKRYGLYAKITGGQRVDLFGAPVHRLPEIWDELIRAGFESGHAYGKAVRTVKSCVGTTWCRYGVQDSVAFAVRIENRYKGIRAPHKVKMAVSGCVRECAEAQSKDVGLIAVENGYNLYVCGNGGAKPRHAELLATDLDEETAVRFIDRFLGYYISTADKLTRTSVWREKLEGGLEHLRDVVVRDKLGIAAELEAMIARLVDSYECEWAAVVRDPEKRRRFRQFVNTDETEPGVEVVHERGQARPASWPSEFVSIEQFRRASARPAPPPERWVRVGAVDDFPKDGGAAVKVGRVQLAVFHFSSRGEWYACQNMCPHRKAFALSSGIVGDAGGVPKVACPVHKKTFSLTTGESLQNEEYRVRTFPARVEGGDVLVQLPPQERLEADLATEVGRRLAASCEAAGCGAAAGRVELSTPAATP